MFASHNSLFFSSRGEIFLPSHMHHPLYHKTNTNFVFIFYLFLSSFFLYSSTVIERRELTKLRIEFETRVTDWREGALHSTYLLLKLQVLSATLAKTKLKPGKFGECLSSPTPPLFLYLSIFSHLNILLETWNLLPVGWTRLADPSGTDGVYFANIITNETSWVSFF